MSGMSGMNAMKKLENNIQRGIRNSTMRQSPGKANKPNRKYAAWTGSTHKGLNALPVELPPAPSAPPMSMNQYKNMLKSQNYKVNSGKQDGGKKSRKHRKSRKATRRRLTRRRR